MNATFKGKVGTLNNDGVGQSLIIPKSRFESGSLSVGKPKSDDKEQAVDKEGSDTESAEDSNSATKVTANGVEQNGNTPKVRVSIKSVSAEKWQFLRADRPSVHSMSTG